MRASKVTRLHSGLGLRLPMLQRYCCIERTLSETHKKRGSAPRPLSCLGRLLRTYLVTYLTKRDMTRPITGYDAAPQHSIKEATSLIFKTANCLCEAIPCKAHDVANDKLVNYDKNEGFTIITLHNFGTACRTMEQGSRSKNCRTIPTVETSSRY